MMESHFYNFATMQLTGSVCQNILLCTSGPQTVNNAFRCCHNNHRRHSDLFLKLTQQSVVCVNTGSTDTAGVAAKCCQLYEAEICQNSRSFLRLFECEVDASPPLKTAFCFVKARNHLRFLQPVTWLCFHFLSCRGNLFCTALHMNAFVSQHGTGWLLNWMNL